MTVAATALAILIIGGTIAQHGSPTALIGVGPESPAHPVVVRDLPHAFEFAGTGLDGALFYVIARKPLDVRATSRNLDYPTYRLRRILFPLIAGTVAPQGGVPLIYVFACLSLIGVALGAWWLGAFPGAPPWLPLLAIINPGMILSLSLTLSDALATGLVLAAFGAMFKKKFALAVIFVLLATLTRETSIIAAFAMAAWPGLDRRRRIAMVVVPAIPIGLWSLYLSHALGESLLSQPKAGTFTLPFLGWIQSGFTGPNLVVPIFGGIIMIASLAKWRRVPLPVTIYVAITVIMLICAAPIIASEWFGTSRVMAVALPLAIWTLARRGSTQPNFTRA